MGATKCFGKFSRGDVVAVRGEDGQILAKGLTSFNQVETEKILGIKSEDIPKVLGTIESQSLSIETIWHSSIREALNLSNNLNTLTIGKNARSASLVSLKFQTK